MSPISDELSLFIRRATWSFHFHTSHSISNHIDPIVNIYLIIGRIIDTCSEIPNFMEFNAMLEKCELHMIVNH